MSRREKVIGISACVAAFAFGFLGLPADPTHAQQQAAQPRNLVIMNGDVYELVPYRGPMPPAPQPGPRPAPVNPIPDPPPPADDGAVPPPADQLQKYARDYIYVIPAFHRQVGKEVKARQLKNRTAAFKRGNELRDIVGAKFGAAVDEAVAKSGCCDEAGNFTDPDKFDAIMQRIASGQEAIIRSP